MSRRSVIKKRPIPPLTRFYNSRLISMMVRRIMRHGKKSIATSHYLRRHETLKNGLAGDPLERFEKAVRNVTPLVEVKARRVGGATYQVPMEVRSDRGTTLALRWLIRFSRQRPGRSMASKLANELMDAANDTGNAIVSGKKPSDGRRKQSFRTLPILITASEA
jgi:small subunit ribosomal protein S7